MNTIKKRPLILDPIDKYMYWLISKFTLIAKRARLIFKWLGKMIIGDGITEQEKEFFTDILYNRKTILA